MSPMNVNDFAMSMGYRVHSCTDTRTSGTAKRKNRTIMEAARSTLFYSKMPHSRPVAMRWHGVANATPWTTGCQLVATTGKFLRCFLVDLSLSLRRDISKNFG